MLYVHVASYKSITLQVTDNILHSAKKIFLQLAMYFSLSNNLT